MTNRHDPGQTPSHAPGFGAANYNKDVQAQQRHARAVAEGRRSQIGNRLVALDFRHAKGVRPADCFAFQSAARSFNVFVLVRATNPASLPYIGRKNFVPKAIDCKPKTAKQDAPVRNFAALSRCAGLVVNPLLAGQGAFAPAKFTSAVETWRHFESAWPPEDCLRQVFPRRREDKGFYAVDLFPGSDRYGCLMVSDQNVPTHYGRFDLSKPDYQGWKAVHMSYIHGDYDLYACIDPDAPNALPIRNQILSVDNIESKDVDHIRMFLNGWLGVEMVQHGEQFHLAHKDEDEGVYAFAPSGGMYFISSARAQNLADLFKIVLGVDT